MNAGATLTKHYQKTDKLALLVNLGLVAYAFILAWWHNTWLEAIVIGGSTALALIMLCKVSPGSVVTRMAMASGFMLLTALHIHQAQGMIEMHFGIFALLAILLCYNDWIPIVTAALVIAVHHVAAFYFQTQGMPIWVLSSSEADWWIIGLHAFYVVAETGILLFIVSRLRKDSLQSEEIVNLAETIALNGKVDLTKGTSRSTKALTSFDDVLQEIARLASQVKHAAKELTIEGNQLSSNTQTMNTAADQQQHETQHLADSMGSVLSAMRDIVEHAGSAAAAASNANQQSNEAAAISSEMQTSTQNLSQNIEQATETIQNLNEQSKSIGAVLDVIRGIAEQTNLLALNAAIEAARAGDQGRGFAVVADEVRTLAQRTQQSTQEIDGMIEGLQTQSKSAVQAIESSHQLADKCRDNTHHFLGFIEQICDSIQSINGMNQQVSDLATSQSATIDQTSASLNTILEISKTAKERCSSTQDSADHLCRMSTDLDNISNQFVIKTGS